MTDQYLLKQIAIEVQKALDNALNPDKNLVDRDRPADAKAVGDALRILSDRLNTLANSDDTTLDQLAEVVAYIKDNRELIEAIVIPVKSVNGKTGNVTLSAGDVGAMPAGTKIPDKTSDLTNDSGYITKVVADLENYYKKSETMNKTELAAALSAIPKFAIQPVDALPTANISATTVYLLKDSSADGNLYTEYIHANGAWEILGSQQVDLTGYATEVFVKDYAQPKGDYALKSDLEELVYAIFTDASEVAL